MYYIIILIILFNLIMPAKTNFFIQTAQFLILYYYKDGWTSLICASNEGHSEVVQLLLSNEANIEAKDNVSYII